MFDSLQMDILACQEVVKMLESLSATTTSYSPHWYVQGLCNPLDLGSALIGEEWQLQGGDPLRPCVEPLSLSPLPLLSLFLDLFQHPSTVPVIKREFIYHPLRVGAVSGTR